MITPTNGHQRGRKPESERKEGRGSYTRAEKYGVKEDAEREERTIGGSEKAAGNRESSPMPGSLRQVQPRGLSAPPPGKRAAVEEEGQEA